MKTLILIPICFFALFLWIGIAGLALLFVLAEKPVTRALLWLAPKHPEK